MIESGRVGILISSIVLNCRMVGHIEVVTVNIAVYLRVLNLTILAGRVSISSVMVLVTVRDLLGVEVWSGTFKQIQLWVGVSE